MRQVFKRVLVMGIILLIIGVSHAFNSDKSNIHVTPVTNPVVDLGEPFNPPSRSLSVPDPGWEMTYSISGTQDTRDVCMTLDGSEFVAAGRSYVTQQRPFLLKTNSQGQQLWYKEYGPWSLYDAAWCLTPTSDGGFVMGGKVQHVGGGDADDILVFKTDANGNFLWKQEHDISGYYDRMWDILELSDGSLVGCGTISQQATYHDAGLIKMNSQGQILWHKFYGQSGTTEVARTLTATKDGGFLIGGYYGWGHGALQNQMYIIKTDANGNVIWTKTIGDTNVWNAANWVGETRYGNFIVSGRTGEAYYGTNGIVLKLDIDGNILWEKVIGGDYNDWFSGGIIYDDEGCSLVGLTQSYSSDPGTSESNRDGWIIRLNASGEKLWEAVHGSPSSTEQFAGIDGITADDGYIVGGSSAGDVYMVKPEGIGYNADDLVTRDSSGYMYLYPLKNENFGLRKRVGHGWNFTHYFVGEWISNGTHDLIVRKSNGELWLYPYRDETFYTYGCKKVGENFYYTHYFVGNWTNNGTDDLIVRDSNGYMWLYTFENETFSAPSLVGSGWNFENYFVGNWTGDGTDDLIIRESNGDMRLYPFRNETFLVPGAGKLVGWGWFFEDYFVGNWTGDGTDDLIVRDSSGTMRLYPFRNETFLVPGSGKTVATGWNFTEYFVGDWKNNNTDDMIVRESDGDLILYPFENEIFLAGTLAGEGFNYTNYLVGQWTNY